MTAVAVEIRPAPPASDTLDPDIIEQDPDTIELVTDTDRLLTMCSCQASSDAPYM